MDIEVERGKYLIAVSGGVDSMVLLDVLADRPGVELYVAHFDHGIRADSAEDLSVVQAAANTYDVPLVTAKGNLGAGASEAVAREARYRFLENARMACGAQAIITAHHQDDLIETALLNMLRGSGRRGLTSLKSSGLLIRPLLDVSKQTIISYALKHDLSWREDSTNYDERYTRNYLRHRLLADLDPDTRQQLLTHLYRLSNANQALDAVLASLVQDELDRRWFTDLTHEVSKEVLAAWLRHHKINDYDRATLERLVVQAKTKPAGKRLNVRRGIDIVLYDDHLALKYQER